MRFLPLLALSGAAVAQQEGVMDKLSAWATNFKTQIINSLPNPIDAGASAVAAQVVQPLNMGNWKAHLWPKEHSPEEWMVYMTGRNKTCFGRCGHVDGVWNQSVAVLAALPSIPSKPQLRLGQISCEDNEILCTAWSVGVPAIWHFLPTTEDGKTTDVRIIRLNVTTASVDDITSIPSSSSSRYLKYTPYEGIMHPIDGTMQKFGLTVPMGYGLWLMGAVPSWLMMLVISFASRQIMNRRLNQGPGGIGGPAPGQAGAGGAGGAGGAVPPAAAAGKASPAGKGGKKKQR